MSLKPKKRRAPAKRVHREISQALDTLIKHKKHIRKVWLEHNEWDELKSDMAYMVNKATKRGKA